MAAEETNQKPSAPTRRILRRALWIAAVVLVAIFGRGVYWHTRWALAHREAAQLPGGVEFVSLAIAEPSGVAYHPQRDSIFVVCDEGELAEYDLTFEEVQRWKIPGDLEGVAFHPDGGTAYIADETAGAIIRFDISAGAVLDRAPIDFSTHPDFTGGTVGNQGIEGIAVVGSTESFALFAVVENRPARLIKLSYMSDEARWRIDESSDLGMTRVAGMTYDAAADRLVVLSSKEKRALCVAPDGRISKTVQLPGDLPEGICILPNGKAIIAHDSGGLSVSDGLGDWIRSDDRFEP